MLFALLFLVVFGIAIGGFVFWIVALVEVAKIPDHQFKASGNEKLVWLLIVGLVGWIGALIYWFAARKAVLAAEGQVPAPPPGWYPDPAVGGVRWWDGTRWTEHMTQPPSSPEPPR